MNYYQWHIGDYRRDTAHLTLLEHGVYRQLLDWYYLSEEPIPEETDSVIRRLCARTEEEKSAVITILKEFFTFSSGWIHGRCDKEISAYKSKADRARENGKLGGRKPKTKVVISGLSNETQAQANHKPLTINHKPIKEIVIPDGINRSAWEEWASFRKSKKKSVSFDAAQKQFKMLLDYPEVTQAEIIGQSIQNDYQGLFPPKGGGNGQAGQSNTSHQRRDNSAVGRVDAAIARELAERSPVKPGFDSKPVAEHDPNLRPQMDEQFRRGAGSGECVGSVLEGTYERAS